MFDFLKRQRLVPICERDRADLLRYYEILAELSFIASYRETYGSEYLAQCGFKFKREGEGTSVSDLWEKTRADRPNVLNDAINTSYRYLCWMLSGSCL